MSSSSLPPAKRQRVDNPPVVLALLPIRMIFYRFLAIKDVAKLTSVSRSCRRLIPFDQMEADYYNKTDSCSDKIGRLDARRKKSMARFDVRRKQLMDERASLSSDWDRLDATYGRRWGDYKAALERVELSAMGYTFCWDLSCINSMKCGCLWDHRVRSINPGPCVCVLTRID